MSSRPTSHASSFFTSSWSIAWSRFERATSIKFSGGSPGRDATSMAQFAPASNKAAAALLEAGANCAMLVAARPGEPPENLLDVARSKRDHAMLQLLVANEEACDVGLEDMESD